MEEFERRFDMNTIIKKHFKPNYLNLLDRIKEIRTPVKNDLLMALLDGKWHSESELIRIGKKQQYIGPVTLGTMMNSLNNNLKSNYLEKQFIKGDLYYKISDNYVGLTRAAYNKYRFSLK